MQRENERPQGWGLGQALRPHKLQGVRLGLSGDL